MLRDETPKQNGQTTLHMQTRRIRMGMPQPSVEPASTMRGSGIQRMRMILFSNNYGYLDDFGSPPIGPRWMEQHARPTVKHFNAEPAVAVPPHRRLASRALYPEPGREIIVAWGDARDLLNCQLAHPERLRDSHQLRCHAQVYEALAPQRCEMLAMAMLGNAPLTDQLHPLTDGLAAKLGLAVSPPPRAASAVQHRQRGVILAGDRLIRLLAASDPTCDDDSEVGTQTRDNGPTRGAPAAPRMGAERGTIPPQPVSAKGRAAAIPERYLQPWEFRRSREEAIYEMHDAARRGWLRRLLRWLRDFRLSRREFFRWQIMIFGKTGDEQLWDVRPPARGLEDAKLRDWAARTLAQAGYDPAFMLSEWEIYWRRKAL